MPVDMKGLIARAALSLLVEKKAKKITVKDIVSECKITRQAFYYHFADIPDLFRWALQQGGELIFREMQAIQDDEERIRYFLLLAVNAKPYVEKSMETNYGPEIEKLLFEQIMWINAKMCENQRAFETLDPFAMNLTLRYHCHAILGIIRDWTDADTEQIDRIVHEIYMIVIRRRVSLN